MRFITRILVLLVITGALGAGFNAVGPGGRSLVWKPNLATDLMKAAPEEVAKHEIKLARARELYEESADGTSGTVYFLDARPHETYLEGHIPGALNAPAAEIIDHAEYIMNNIPAVDDVMVVVYCGGGDCRDSKAAFRDLKEFLGYTNVVIYKAGWEEWEDLKNELPIEEGDSPIFPPAGHDQLDDGAFSSEGQE